MYTFQRKPKKYEQGPRKYSHKRREPNGPEHARENFFAGHCKKVFQRALAFLRRARENKLRARHRPLFFWKLIVLQRTHTHPPDNRRRQLVRGRFGELRGGGGVRTRGRRRAARSRGQQRRPSALEQPSGPCILMAPGLPQRVRTRTISCARPRCIPFVTRMPWSCRGPGLSAGAPGPACRALRWLWSIQPCEYPHCRGRQLVDMGEETCYY